MKPFLKWAGGKSRLVGEIGKELGSLREGRLVEPFAGSGAVFCGIDWKGYVVADVNRDLIELYTILRDEKDVFIGYCQEFFTPATNNREAFNALRAEFNTLACGNRKRAAIFVYLNRHCFNGLCRYSKNGFNVPYGQMVRPPGLPAKEMLAFAHRARKAEFRHCGFLETMRSAREGDVVYCDPPYLSLSQSKVPSFSDYAAGGFSWADHQALADECRALAARGIRVVLSNHETDSTSELYHEGAIRPIKVRRSISADGNKRLHASEILVTFGSVQDTDGTGTRHASGAAMSGSQAQAAQRELPFMEMPCHLEDVPAAA